MFIYLCTQVLQQSKKLTHIMAKGFALPTTEHQQEQPDLLPTDASHLFVHAYVQAQLLNITADSPLLIDDPITASMAAAASI